MIKTTEKSDCSEGHPPISPFSDNTDNTHHNHHNTIIAAPPPIFKTRIEEHPLSFFSNNRKL
jgi:hypothetical protein